MHPILFKVGPFVLRTYGVLLVLGFGAGIWLSFARARRRGLSTDMVLNAAFVIIVSSLIGSRLYYVLFHLSEFSGGDWWRAFVPLQPDGSIGLLGMSMFGGVLLAAACALVYLRMNGQNALSFADALAPGVMLGLGIARVGCFFNGCCFGLPCDHAGFPCVVFPAESQAGFVFPQTALVPAQLISSLKGFAIFGLLVAIERRVRFTGSTFLLMLTFYSIGRFFVDFARYYEHSMTFARAGGVAVSMNQLLGVATAIASTTAWFILRARSRRE